MPSILFVCKANQFRSPIAAACFKRVLAENGSSEDWKVNSAGTWAESGSRASPEAVRAASTIHIDLGSHVAHEIVPSLLESSDLILVMESGQKEALSVEFPLLRQRVYLLSEVVDGIPYDIPDMGMPDHTLEEVAQDLSDLVQRGFPKICQLASSMPGIQR